LCCNIFEHVQERQKLAAICAVLVPRGGYVVFSGPFSYPYHPDPLDNMFRPEPHEVAAMFPEFDVIAASIVASTSWGAEQLERPLQIPLTVAQTLVRLARFWGGRRRYFEENHRLLWLFRPFKATCVILRKR
jgi:hypothetical protein